MYNLASATLAIKLIVRLVAECLLMYVTCHTALFYDDLAFTACCDRAIVKLGTDWLRALLYTADLTLTLIAKTGAFGKKNSKNK